MLSSAEQQYADQRRIAVLVEQQVRSQWRSVSPTSIDASWQQIFPAVLRMVIAGQLAGARLADPFVERALAEQGIDPATTAAVVPEAFAGAASDGRDLSTLVGEPVIQAKTAIGAGAAPAQALAAAESSLLRIALTQVADAGRVAALVGIGARPQVQGYVRVLRAPSCSRCAVLAGRWYRFSAAFARHPHCDCGAAPAQESGSSELTTDPSAAVRAGQVRGLSVADAKAIRDGADVSQVVNAHRTGMAPAGFTTEGTSRRGLAGQRLGTGVARMTPERIYQTTDSREAAIEALRRNGYVL